MKTFKQFLFESLVKIEQSDLNLLYYHIKDAAKDLKTIFNQKNDEDMRKLGRKMYDKYDYFTESRNYIVLNSSRLKSKKCKEAHEILPVNIEIGIIPVASYSPIHKTIKIGITKNAFNAACLQADLDFIKEFPLIVTEFNELRIKSTIQHELAHWIDDALHNKHMTKSSDSAEKFQDHILGGNNDVGLGYIEVQAQVNQINYIKKKLGSSKWNSISWNDLMNLHPALDSLNSRLGSKWRKLIISRMAREGILGKNMKV